MSGFDGYDQWKTASPFDDPDWGEEEIIEALKGLDTGRCGAECDCCMTGKNADLEPYGAQWIIVNEANEDGVNCTVKGYKTIVGEDVCLNLPSNTTDADYMKALDEYLEITTEIVCGCNSEGEWDGDSWGLTFTENFTVEWLDDDEPNWHELAQAIITKAGETINYWENEVIEADKMADIAAGYHDYEIFQEYTT